MFVGFIFLTCLLVTLRIGTKKYITQGAMFQPIRVEKNTFSKLTFSGDLLPSA